MIDVNISSKALNQSTVSKYYYCDNCHRIKKLTIYSDNTTVELNNDKDVNVIIRSKSIDAYVYCRKCDTFMANMDPDIVYTIKRLNDKGYETFHSCQGHVYYNGIDGTGSVGDAAYIVIALDEKARKEVEHLLAEYNNPINNANISFKSTEIDGMDYIKDGYRIAVRMADLTDDDSGNIESKEKFKELERRNKLFVTFLKQMAKELSKKEN